MAERLVGDSELAVADRLGKIDIERAARLHRASMLGSSRQKAIRPFALARYCARSALRSS